MAATGEAAQASVQPAAPLPYASLPLRVVAAVLDSIALIFFFMLFVAVGGLQVWLRSDHFDRDPPVSAIEVWVIFMLAFIPFAVLYFILPWLWKGQSVGMAAVHIKVARRDGGPLSLGRAAARTLAWPLSILPLGLGLVTIVLDREKRALHDYLADTTVFELP